MRIQDSLALLRNCHGNYIYVLLLTGGRIYVGSTDQLTLELEQVLMGQSRQEWLTEFAVHGILEIRHTSAVTAPGLLFQTTELTIQYMQRFGIENVRGGELTEYPLNIITNRLISPDFGRRFVTVQQLVQQASLVPKANHLERVIYVLALSQHQYYVAISQDTHYLTEIKAIFAAPFNYPELQGLQPLRVVEQIATRTTDIHAANHLYQETYRRLAAKVGAENILFKQAMAQ